MSLNLKVYDNGDHTCLVWLPSDGKPIPNCRGFTVRRVSQDQESYLHGFVGFSDADKLDPNNLGKFPVQRFMWWDYSVTPGDTIQYSVVPVVGADKDYLQLDAQNASPLTPPLQITGQRTPHVSAYFNKGVVASQWVSRALDTAPKNSKIKDLVATANNPLRNALSGLLRPQILQLLQDTKKNNGKIYARQRMSRMLLSAHNLEVRSTFSTASFPATISPITSSSFFATQQARRNACSPAALIGRPPVSAPRPITV